MLGTEVSCTTFEPRLQAFTSIIILVWIAARVKISMQYKLYTFKDMRGERRKWDRNQNSDEKSFEDFAKLPQADTWNNQTDGDKT